MQRILCTEYTCIYYSLLVFVGYWQVYKSYFLPSSYESRLYVSILFALENICIVFRLYNVKEKNL